MITKPNKMMDLSKFESIVRDPSKIHSVIDQCPTKARVTGSDTAPSEALYEKEDLK